MNITGVVGLTDAQQSTLKMLGAVDNNLFINPILSMTYR